MIKFDRWILTPICDCFSKCGDFQLRRLICTDSFSPRKSDLRRYHYSPFILLLLALASPIILIPTPEFLSHSELRQARADYGFTARYLFLLTQTLSTIYYLEGLGDFGLFVKTLIDWFWRPSLKSDQQVLMSAVSIVTDSLHRIHL